MKFVLASHNAKKLVELKAVLAKAFVEDIEVLSAKELGLKEPVENGTSFSENALIKARAAAEATGMTAIADDSGLCVDILSGAPGIFSARWSGLNPTDEKNNRLLLEQLADIPASHRQASFICAAAAVIKKADSFKEIVCLGKMTGTILFQPKGINGFGYDPIFQPTGYDLSAAELSQVEKNKISHRALAFADLAQELSAEIKN